MFTIYLNLCGACIKKKKKSAQNLLKLIKYTLFETRTMKINYKVGFPKPFPNKLYFD